MLESKIEDLYETEGGTSAFDGLFSVAVPNIDI